MFATFARVFRGKIAVALLVLLPLAFCALLAPVLTPHDPTETDISQRFQKISAEHPLGTDHLGRDIFARIIYGARVSFGAVLGVCSCILVIGFVVGSISGYVGGRLDGFLMRLCDSLMTFPTFVLSMVFVGIFGTGMLNVILAIAMTHWAWYARLIRGLVLSLKTRGFVVASRVAGTSHAMVFLRHILPSVVVQIVVMATLDIGHMMLHVAGLSFLGLGVQPPTPEWGSMIGDAVPFIRTQPSLMFYPGLMIFLSTGAFNLLGDSLRDLLDPTLAHGEH